MTKSENCHSPLCSLLLGLRSKKQGANKQWGLVNWSHHLDCRLPLSYCNNPNVASLSGECHQNRPLWHTKVRRCHGLDSRNQQLPHLQSLHPPSLFFLSISMCPLHRECILHCHHHWWSICQQTMNYWCLRIEGQFILVNILFSCLTLTLHFTGENSSLFSPVVKSTSSFTPARVGKPIYWWTNPDKILSLWVVWLTEGSAALHIRLGVIRAIVYGHPTLVVNVFFDTCFI